MVSDVPLGAFLSGGVDSSITVAMMSALAGHRVKTFSVGFTEEGSHIDETEDARKTAAFLGTDHQHVIVRGEDVLENIFHIASGLDQPTVDGVNSYFVSWAAHQHVTVAVSGTGGDELFAGYPWYINMLRESQTSASPITRLAASVARQPVFDSLMATRWKKNLYKLRTGAGFLSRYALQYFIFGSAGTVPLLSPAIRRQTHAGRSEAIDLASFDELPDAAVLERVTALCLRGYTANQLLRDIDVASMSHSLEVRVPFLDTDLADLALSLPAESKLFPPAIKDESLPPNTYRALGVKRILIDAGKPFLPEGFDVQPKRGFAMPFHAWLRGPLNDLYRDTLSETSVSKRSWFSSDEVSRVRKDFDSYVIDWTYPWLLMMTELWAREVLDKS
jgi:asparagine synthase (glutamine-hydrolysing)